MTVRAAIFVVSVVAIATACEGPLEVGCPAVVRPSLSLEIRDASTGMPAWFGATVTAFHDGGVVPFSDVRRDADSTDQVQLTTDYYSPGRFEVAVAKPGFELWIATNVRVERSGPPCPVTRTVTLRVPLQPA